MKYFFIIITFILSSCARTPENSLVGRYTNIEPKLPNTYDSMGSIYQATEYTGYSYQPMFEDSRPRNVGDLLTVQIAENFNATNDAASNATGNDPAAQPSFWDLLLGTASAEDFVGNNAPTTGSSNSTAQNTINGTLTVTVSNVLANGNLRVVGEKQTTINSGTKYIRFSGIVNPRTISNTNTVSSTQIADAQIEYVDYKVPLVGWWQRFLAGFSPPQ